MRLSAIVSSGLCLVLLSCGSSESPNISAVIDASGDASGEASGDASGDASPDGLSADTGSITDDASQDTLVAEGSADGEDPDVDFGYDASSQDGFTEACVTASIEAALKPLDLYFMVDSSGTMAGAPWQAQSTALKNFFNDPQSNGLGVALRFFPSSSYDTFTCSGADYMKPQVDWGFLSAHAATLIQKIDGTTPGGGTPTQEALNGVLKGAKARQLAQPDRAVVAVLVSDGAPQSCPQKSAAQMGAIAASYYEGTPSIRTYTIFVSSEATPVMTEIAIKGGTKKSYDAIGGSQPFLDALKDIHGTAIPCNFPMPTSNQGIVNPDNVRLYYLSGVNSTPVARVDEAQCAAGGWYYDTPASPTKIILCPTTCSTMKAEPGAKMRVELGCLGS